MAIVGDEPVFPDNAIALIAIALDNIDPDVMVLKRMLRPTDPSLAIGVFASLWEPDDDSKEMGHPFPHEPTLQTYQIGIQSLVKDGEEVRGLTRHSILSSRVRSVLYRSIPLRVALQSLSVTDGTSTERVGRWGIRSQRYMNNDIEGKFVYLSTLEYWVETRSE